MTAERSAARDAQLVALGDRLPAAEAVAVAVGVAAAAAPTRERRPDEVPEQRRRALRARLELGMELRGHEEGVLVELDHLDETLVGRRGADDEAGRLQAATQEEIDLVAVAVALVDDGLAVERAGTGAGVD